MTRRRGPTILAVALLVAAACGDRADEGGAPEAVADEERPPGSPAPEPADEPEDEPTSDAEPTAEEPPESSEEASEPETEP